VENIMLLLEIQSSLKRLSSGMGLAENGINQQISLEERSTKIFGYEKLISN
jgi:hypothetical protein